MLQGLVLAAGESSRMGSPKALLLTPRGQTFLAAIVETFRAAGVEEIAAVTGRHHDRIAAALEKGDAGASLRLVRNPDPTRGQLSSLLTGMDAVVGPSTEALLVTLVDVPMTAAGTVRDVIAAWRRTGAPIVRPAIGDRHGHPVLFDRRVFDELRAAPLDAGAKTVVRAHEGELVNVPVSDAGCLVDIDTPAEYESLRPRA